MRAPVRGNSGAWRLRKGQPAESIIKYKQNIVNINAVNDFIEVYSYIVSFNDMFRL